MFYGIIVPGVPGRISAGNNGYEKVRRLKKTREKGADFCENPQDVFGKEAAETSRTGDSVGMVIKAKGKHVLAMMGQSGPLFSRQQGHERLQ